MQAQRLYDLRRPYRIQLDGYLSLIIVDSVLVFANYDAMPTMKVSGGIFLCNVCNWFCLGFFSVWQMFIV